MKWIAAWCAGAWLLVASASGQSFEDKFRNPPEAGEQDARVMMRWWWFGPAVTKPELLREMQQMKAGGIGGLEIQPVYPLALDDPQTGFHNEPYLSAEFLDNVRYVNEEAAKLGLRVSLTLSSGWPYGGPHTPVTEAAGALHLETVRVAAGETSVAMPALGAGESLEAAFVAAGPGSKPAMVALPAVGSRRLLLQGAADGDRSVTFFVASRTGQQVKRAAFGAEGFVLDHFSREAVQQHLRDVADPLMTAFSERPPYSVFSDSLEVYGSDWTPGMLDEFRKRRGYELREHLPELFAEHPDEEALAVRHDWGQTLTELVDENYVKPINDWAHAHHTLFRSQTYGDPAVSLSSNALVDLPEGEGPQWQLFSYTRWATSAAHVYERPVVSAETWTWLHSPAFRATPLDMKAEADRFFLQGITQFVGHGWAYSPPSAGEPGWRFYAAAVFNDHNPWWLVMPDVMKSLERTSWALRQGEPANQVAVYLPEDDAYAAFVPGKVSLSDVLPRWVTPELTQAIEEGGYNFDYIDAAAIAERGMRYPVLVLPEVDRMSAKTLDAIARYCDAGGKVFAVGRLPEHEPGLKGLGAPSDAVRMAAKKLFDAGGRAVLIPDVRGLEAALHAMAEPDMRLDAPLPAVGFIRRRLKDADLYFVANTGNVPVETTAHFAGDEKVGEWLDADTGEARPVSVGQGVRLKLAPYESRLLWLRAGVSEAAAEEETQMVKDLSGDWSLRFEGTGHEEKMATLASWADEPGVRFYSGVVTYRKTVVVEQPSRQGDRWVLSFGDGKASGVVAADAKEHPGMHAELDAPIRDAAVVSVNGERAGAVWHAPFEIDVTRLLRAGSNTLEVRVANTAINEMAGTAQPDYRLLWLRYGQRFTPQDMEHLEPLPSGLLGPVKLLQRSAR